jgi:hypothetical protein
MNKQVLILTGTTDEYLFHENGVKMQEVFDLALPSKERYAKKYNYDLLTIRSFKNGNIYGFNKDIDLGFLRVTRAFEMLAHYDLVMWIDADAIITNDIPISDFPIEQKTFCASYDWAWRQSFSTGNFIIQRTPEYKLLFDLFLQIGSQFSGRVLQEQETLNYIYRNLNEKNTIKILEHKFLNAVPSFVAETETWRSDKNRTQIISPWNEDCFLAHLTGCSNQERVDMLKTTLKQFL